MAREFPTSVAAAITGASVRRLDEWARTQLLPPSGRQAAGKGTRRSYTFQDLISIRTIVDLRARKCPLQQIRAALSELHKLDPSLSNSQTLARLTLLTDGKRVYLLTDESQAMDVLTRQTVWAVPLGRHILETAERVAKLPQAWIEEIRVNNRLFHCHVTRHRQENGFVAHCKELPGVLEQAPTTDAVIRQMERSIGRVLEFMSRSRQSGAIVRQRAAN